MRFIAVDWGTSRFRAYLVADGAILDRREGEEGIASLAPGRHAEVFWRHCGAWLEAEPGLDVAMVGMVGSREGWAMAPYATCPAGPADLAQALMRVELGRGRSGFIVPGLTCAPFPGGADVMRGEETHVLGAGVRNGLVCLPGTHCKWVEMRDGRVHRFATAMTGEVFALMRHHSMVGRPATEPADPSGFGLGLAAAERNSGAEGRPGLLHLLFGARAAVLTGVLSHAQLGPYLSGLLTGDEINGALSLFGRPEVVTIVADPPRADLYREALGRRGIDTRVEEQEPTLLAGLALIVVAQA
jgi:2-dehydro-3-deoxygalactonokinase